MKSVNFYFGDIPVPLSCLKVGQVFAFYYEHQHDEVLWVVMENNLICPLGTTFPVPANTNMTVLPCYLVDTPAP